MAHSRPRIRAEREKAKVASGNAGIGNTRSGTNTTSKCGSTTSITIQSNMASWLEPPIGRTRRFKSGSRKGHTTHGGAVPTCRHFRNGRVRNRRARTVECWVTGVKRGASGALRGRPNPTYVLHFGRSSVGLLTVGGGTGSSRMTRSCRKYRREHDVICRLG